MIIVNATAECIEESSRSSANNASQATPAEQMTPEHMPINEAAQESTSNPPANETEQIEASLTDSHDQEMPSVEVVQTPIKLERPSTSAGQIFKTEATQFEEMAADEPAENAMAVKTEPNDPMVDDQIAPVQTEEVTNVKHEQVVEAEEVTPSVGAEAATLLASPIKAEESRDTAAATEASQAISPSIKVEEAEEANARQDTLLAEQVADIKAEQTAVADGSLDELEANEAGSNAPAITNGSTTMKEEPADTADASISIAAADDTEPPMPATNGK